MPDNFLDFITLGMGNSKSKPKERFGRTKKDSSIYSAKRSGDSTREHDFSADIHARFAEDEELKILRHNIRYNPELFILNNLMMCVQFFKNYDEEITSIRNSSVSSREAELNDRLRPHKHVLIPDILQQHVSQRIDFTYRNPNVKPTIELLHPIRIFVGFKNIEVTEENFVSPYSDPNNEVTYIMQLKPSPSHKGYVLLSRLEENPSKKAVSVDNLTSISNGTRDEIYSDGGSLYGAKSNASGTCDANKNLHDEAESIYDERRYGSHGNLPVYPSTSRTKDEGIYEASTSKIADSQRGRTINNRQYGRTRLLHSANESTAGSTSSGYRSGNCMDSDSDYSYARTTYNTPKTSKSSLDSGSLVSSTDIPRNCFRTIEYTHDGEMYEPPPEKQQKMPSTEQLIREAWISRNYKICYFNSAKFMKYFCRLFVHQLAGLMDFNSDIRKSVVGGAICRTKLQVLLDKTEKPIATKVEEFEIIPSVKSQWPECANEWLDRPRTTWPHYSIIEEVRKFGCYMIPDGIPSDKMSRYQDLEWQLVFPAAERYLETCLTYPQVRVYLMALMLQKTFMKPVNSIFGLSVTHIKHRLFWLIEEDNRPSMWTENRAGDSLMKLLKSLYRSISLASPCIPDYFVREKNLLQEKPYLTQRQLNRIIGNPVMYVFHAMENIRHSSEFFPRLNFEELFRILTDDTLFLANPDLAQHVPRQLPRGNNIEDDTDQVLGFWDETNQQYCEQQKIYGRKPVKKKSLINPRRACDQVQEISIRCERLEPRRLSSLLDFFIRHFIKMAESCHNYRALPQKIAYVDEAERLAVLLSEHPTHKDIAKTYLEKLYSLKRRAPRSRSSQNTTATTPPPNPPETPRRNADKAIFERPLMRRYENPENLEEQSKSVDLTKTEEAKVSQLENPSRIFYNLQPPPASRRAVVTATIHEEDTENIHLRNSISKIADPVTSSSNDKTRVVTIADISDDSFLSDTTYI